MSKSTILTATRLALGLTMVLSCSDDPVVPPAGSTYVLQAVDGEGLPLTVTPAPGVTYTLVGDTLQFFGEGSYSRIIVIEREDPQASQIEVNSDTLQGTVVSRNGALVLEFVCQDVIIRHLSQCVPPDTGRTIGSRLLLRSFLPPPGEKLFVRSDT